MHSLAFFSFTNHHLKGVRHFLMREKQKSPLLSNVLFLVLPHPKFNFLSIINKTGLLAPPGDDIRNLLNANFTQLAYYDADANAIVTNMTVINTEGTVDVLYDMLYLFSTCRTAASIAHGHSIHRGSYTDRHRQTQTLTDTLRIIVRDAC